MVIVKTVEGDTVDKLARDHLGSEVFAQAILEANNGLAAKGPRFGPGITVQIPDVPQTDQTPGTFKLWDD